MVHTVANASWEADKMYVLPAWFVKALLSIRVCKFFCFASCRLDVYINDYLEKRNLTETAKVFRLEANVSSDPVGKELHRTGNTSFSTALTYTSGCLILSDSFL